MKLLCIKNYEPGFFGYDYRDEFTICNEYTIVSVGTSTRIFNDLGEWRYFSTQIIDLFEPLDEK